MKIKLSDKLKEKLGAIIKAVLSFPSKDKKDNQTSNPY